MGGLELHYFPIRGLGEQSRLALTLSGAEWTDVPVTDYALMKSDAKTFHFAQCPILKDGDFVLAQSLAILYYVGRKFNLVGSTEQEKAEVDQAIQGVASLRTKYLELIYQHALADDKKAEYWELHGNPASAHTGQRNGGAHWVYISELLKANCADGKGFIVGKTATIADCYLFDVLDLYVRIFGDEMKVNYPELMAFHAHFSAIPSIAEYISTKQPAKINGNTLG